MRWRFVDRLGSIEPWQGARAEKCVSVEEYFLLERLGRRGTLPENLLLASFVELARWLVIVSSEFRESALLTEITDFRICRPLSMGAVLELDVAVVGRTTEALTLLARGASHGEAVCEGTLTLAPCPLGELCTTATARRLWQELHAAAR